jgi:cytochrome c553
MKKRVTLALVVGAMLAAGAVPALAAGSAAAGKTKSATCAGCHGPDGNSLVPTFPRLAGLSAAYIAKQLADFKDPKSGRTDPTMGAMAAPLSPQDIADLAAYFSSQKPAAGSASATPEMIKDAERLYRGGNTKFGVPACMGCHGPSGQGIPPRFPRVSGQHAGYTQKQLLAFKSGSRTNDGKVMTSIAFKLSESDIKAVSEYMAGLH